MTEDQLEVVKKIDEMLNDVCMPTYSKLSALIRDEAEFAEDRMKKFRDAVKVGNYSIAQSLMKE